MKILKAATPRRLTHDQASKGVLDRFEEIITTLDSICEDTFEPKLRCYRADMMEQVNMSTLCLMTNILGIIKFFSLVLQKQERKFTDLTVIMESTVKTLESLSSTMVSEQFKNVISLLNTKNKSSY